MAVDNISGRIQGNRIGGDLNAFVVQAEQNAEYQIEQRDGERDKNPGVEENVGPADVARFDACGWFFRVVGNCVTIEWFVEMDCWMVYSKSACTN